MAIQKLKNLFAIDLRSLAAFRIGTAAILIWDLALRLRDLEAFYTDSGVMPRGLWREAFAHKLPQALHMLGGSTEFAAALFAAAFAAAFALALGWRTRWSAAVSYLLLLSLHLRNPQVLSLGDALLRVMLFWSLFLPLGARWSLDARAGRADKWKNERTVSSAASAALLLQIAVMYWTTALLKTAPEWKNGEALYYALSLEHMNSPLAAQLLAFPALLTAMTHATLALETFGPFLLLSPFYPGVVRTLAIAAFAAFHTGIACTIYLGLFPAIDIVSLLPFVPAVLWDKLPFARQRASAPPAAGGPAWKKPAGWAVQSAVALLFVYVVVWNADTVIKKWKMPKPFTKPAYWLGINQAWGMYAPSPSDFDGWFVAEGVLENGARVDLMRGGAPVRWTKPADIPATLKNYRWRKFMFKMVSKGHSPLFKHRYTRWAASRWNLAQSDPSRRIARLNLYFTIERTPPPGRPVRHVRRLISSFIS